MEANKMISKNILYQNVYELTSKLSIDVKSFKSIFKNIIRKGLPSPWDGNSDLYLKGIMIMFLPSLTTCISILLALNEN